jgi:hypothetical protein
MGQPTKYNKEIVESILERLATGQSIRTAVIDEGITWPTWRTWLRNKADLREKYDQAKEDGIEYTLGEIEHIAQDTVQRAKTKKADIIEVKAVETLIKNKQWLASKLHAKKYGSHQQMTIGNIENQSFKIDWDK